VCCNLCCNVLQQCLLFRVPQVPWQAGLVWSVTVSRLGSCLTNDLDPRDKKAMGSGSSSLGPRSTSQGFYCRGFYPNEGNLLRQYFLTSPSQCCFPVEKEIWLEFYRFWNYNLISWDQICRRNHDWWNPQYKCGIHIYLLLKMFHYTDSTVEKGTVIFLYSFWSPRIATVVCVHADSSRWMTFPSRKHTLSPLAITVSLHVNRFFCQH